MGAVAFDTYKAVKSLKEAGFTEEQASAITNSVKDMGREAELVTKRDLEQSIESVRTELKDVRTELKQDIENVRVELKQDIENVRVELKDVRTELKQDILNLEHKIETRVVRLEVMMGLVLAGIVALVLKSFFHG